MSETPFERLVWHRRVWHRRPTDWPTV